MGFLDKAKKMAEQAQTRLDEVQKQFNENQGASQTAGGPVTEYDEHGRPVAPAPEAAAPPPSPPPPPPAPPAPEAAAPPPPAPPTPPTVPQADREDEYAPPKLTSGDPLEG